MSDEPKTPDPVPYERFQAVVAERNTLRDADAARATEMQKLTERAATVDALTAALAEAKAGRAADADAWGQERALMGAGFTDAEGQTVARALFAAQPEAIRAKPIGDWLGGLKAEGATVPKALAPYLSPAAPTTTTTAPPPKAPAAQGGTSTAPGANGATSAAALKALREAASKSGDWAAFNAAAGVKP